MAAAQGEARKPYLYGLDLVRFAASALVMAFHFAVFAPTGADATVSTILQGRVAFPVLFPLFRQSWVGVDVFFVISGLVIAYSAEGSGALAFARRRALRLLPAAWISATLSLAVAASLSLYPVRELMVRYLDALVFWPTGPWIDGTYWTLPIELSFYFLVFVTLALKRFRWVEGLTALLGIASTAYWAVGPMISPIYWWMGLTRMGQDFLVDNGCQFALGVFLWAIFTRGATWPRLGLAAVCAGGCVLEVIHASSNHAQVLSLSDPGPTGALALFIGGVAAIIASLWFAPRIEAALGPRTGLWIRRFGLATYPLYLFHTTVGAAIIRVLVEAGVAPYGAFVIAAVGCSAIALLIAIVLEPWLRGRLAAALGGRTPRAVPATETV